jgi:hypothetical protein
VCIVAVALTFALSRLRSGPDPGSLVYAARQGVFRHDLETGKDTRLAVLPDGIEVAMPSPDGRYVAYALGEGQLWLASLEREKAFQVAERFTVPLGWSPDGRLIAGELLSDRDLVAVDPDGDREILLSGGYATGSLPVWIDDDRFAIASDDDSFVIVDGTEASKPIDGHPLAASPDGAELLVLRDRSVVVGKVGGAQLRNVRRLLKKDASYGAASPAGFLAVAAADGVHVFRGGTESERVVDHPVDWVGWARAGAVLLYAQDGAVYALELPDGKPKRVTRDDADVLPLLAFSVVP